VLSISIPKVGRFISNRCKSLETSFECRRRRYKVFLSFQLDKFDSTDRNKFGIKLNVIACKFSLSPPNHVVIELSDYIRQFPSNGRNKAVVALMISINDPDAVVKCPN